MSPPPSPKLAESRFLIDTMSESRVASVFGFLPAYIELRTQMVIATSSNPMLLPKTRRGTIHQWLFFIAWS